MTPKRLTALAAAAFVATAAGFGPGVAAAVTGSDGRVGDLVQDWLSAKDYAGGFPVYEPMADSLRRHVGMDQPDLPAAYNAHPPASVLVALPLGRLSYPAAHRARNLAGVVLLAGALAGLLRGAGPPAAVGLFAAAACLVCNPVVMHFAYAQWHAVLLALGVFAWRADRAGWPAAAGAAVGTAGALKLFPLFLLIPLAFGGRRRVRSVAAAGAAFAAWNLAAAAVFGPADIRAYVLDAVPSLARFKSEWHNVSAAGVTHRLFDPVPASRVVALVRCPAAATGLWLLAASGVAGACARLAWLARTPAGRDRAFAAAATGARLASPLTWPHSFVLLAGPVLFAARAAATPGRRAATAAVLIVLAAPVEATARLLLGPDAAAGLMSAEGFPLTPGENLLATSGPAAALAGLFALVVTAPVPAGAGGVGCRRPPGVRAAVRPAEIKPLEPGPVPPGATAREADPSDPQAAPARKTAP